MLEITEYAGRSMVMGHVREVVVAQNNLTIRGVNVEEANRILATLAALGQGATIPSLIGGAQAGNSAADTPPTPAPKKETGKPTAKAETTAPKKEAKKEDDLPGTLGQGGEGPTPDAPNGNGQHDTGDDVLAGKLADLTRLADVVSMLRDNGVTEEKQVLATCKRLRTKVKALNKLSDEAIAERVPRVLEALADN